MYKTVYQAAFWTMRRTERGLPDDLGELIAHLAAFNQAQQPAGHETGQQQQAGHEPGQQQQAGHEAGQQQPAGHEAGQQQQAGHQAGQQQLEGQEADQQQETSQGQASRQQAHGKGGRGGEAGEVAPPGGWPPEEDGGRTPKGAAGV
jgi:hypothetical protein